MKLPSLDAFCSHDDFRQVMNCVYIDGKYAVSSDAHILVKVDISEYFDNVELMNKKLIHRSVWWQMMYATTRTATETGIKCSYENFECEYSYFKTDSQYPDYMKVIKIDEDEQSKGIIDIGFSPHLLKRLSLITDEVIHFRFVESGKSILISNDDFAGIIMPAMVSNHNWKMYYKLQIGL